MAADDPNFAVRLAAGVFGNLPMLKEVERASGLDLQQVRGDNGRNLLHLAVTGSFVTGQLDVCRYLVEEKGFDVNSTSDEGETTVLVATDTPWVLDGLRAGPVVPILTYFLDLGVDPAVPDATGITPLYKAAGYGHKEAIELLLSRGVPVDPLSYNGTPLSVAAKMGQAHAVKILLEHGADPNRVINRVWSPLLMACSHGHLECVKLLVEAGADVNFCPYGSTMLIAAIGSGSIDIVNFMLEAGADPNIHDGELYVEPIANVKSEGRQAFANGDYGHAMYCFSRASTIDPDDATLQANLSLCFLKMRNGMGAVDHAKKCQRLRPRWPKAWFREGEPLSFLRRHRQAVTAFQEALRLDPGSVEIKNKLREAKEAMSK